LGQRGYNRAHTITYLENALAPLLVCRRAVRPIYAGHQCTRIRQW